MVAKTQSDISVQADVLDELEQDPEVDVTAVGVIVADRVVTLTGMAESYPQKIAAERAALRVFGVRAVANDLVVAPEVAGIHTDGEIARCIADALEANAAVSPGITALVEDGRVTLYGEATWHHQRQEAERVARGIAGVRSVTNQIRIMQPPVAAKDVHYQIVRSLLRQAAVDAGRVNIVVDNGHVTLTGAVRSRAERDEAEAAVWRTLGVTSVSNELSIDLMPAS